MACRRETGHPAKNHEQSSIDFMHADGWTWSFEQRIASDPAEGRMVVAQLLEELERQKWSENDAFAVHLALEEALVNAIKHGNHKDPTKNVDVRCRMKADRVEICIEDEGEGFDPSEVPDPTEEENLEVPSGRGLMLMRCYMNKLEFNKKGNRVTMEKIRSN
jgi:serine/threonine-protein kinase RsbW